MRGWVFSLVQVAGMVIQLFSAVPILDVVPAIGADRVVTLPTGHHDWAIPFPLWILQKGLKAVTVQLLSLWPAAHVDERRIYIDQADRTMRDFQSFRPFFVSQAFTAGATEAEIMSWVGHRDSRTVALYRHPGNRNVQRKMQQINFIRPDMKPDGPTESDRHGCTRTALTRCLVATMPFLKAHARPVHFSGPFCGDSGHQKPVETFRTEENVWDEKRHQGIICTTGRPLQSVQIPSGKCRLIYRIRT